MKQYIITNIDWDISDEGYDDNDLPITAKDLGLPAYDEKVIINSDKELDDDDIVEWLTDKYGYCILGCSISYPDYEDDLNG